MMGFHIYKRSPGRALPMPFGLYVQQAYQETPAQDMILTGESRRTLRSGGFKAEIARISANLAGLRAL
jgi:hypothetical protein